MSMLYPGRRPALRRSSGRAWRSRADQSFTADDTAFLHPSLAPIAQLYAEGKVTAMPAIGYDHPDQSHFTSRHYWEVGATETDLQTGWLGRYLDEVGTDDNPLQGLSMTGQLEPALATAKVPGRRHQRARPVHVRCARASGGAFRNGCSTRCG